MSSGQSSNPPASGRSGAGEGIVQRRAFLVAIAAAVVSIPMWATDAAGQQSPMGPGPAQVPPAGSDLKAVLKGVICRCGCNLSVYDCEATMTCDVAVGMRADAQDMLDEGMSVPQVLDAFAADYGEQVLAAPTKRGFNLTAWVLPFVALLMGAIAVLLTVRSRRVVPEAAGEVPADVDPAYVAAVEDEVEREG